MKKTLTTAEIEKLANLSNLTLTEEEMAKIGTQFSETITYIENLNDLDTSKISSITNVTGQENKFFEDGEENMRLFIQEEATSNSRSKKNGLFVVPKVFK